MLQQHFCSRFRGGRRIQWEETVEDFRMSVGAVVTWLLSLLSAVLVTPLVIHLNGYLASILPYKRNIFTYLDQFFIRAALLRVYAGVSTFSDILERFRLRKK